MEEIPDIKIYERYFQNPLSEDEILHPPAHGVACGNIRQALQFLGYDIHSGIGYDEELVQVIRAFQTDSQHYSRDGLFGPGTRRLLTQKLIEKWGKQIFHRLKDPGGQGQGYLFVSYKREDWTRIKAILDQLTEWGYTIWYDKGIPGGAEWDALIESKVAGCDMLLVFISQAAADSKWVRREIKYADSLNKPILTVRLEEVVLRYGLEMLLTQYQMINAYGENFSLPGLVSEIRKAIAYVRLL